MTRWERTSDQSQDIQSGIDLVCGREQSLDCPGQMPKMPTGKNLQSEPMKPGSTSPCPLKKISDFSDAFQSFNSCSTT